MLEDEDKQVKVTTTTETDEKGNKVVVTTEEDKAIVLQQEEDDDKEAAVVVIPPKNNKKRNGIIIGVVVAVVIIAIVLALCLTLVRCDSEPIEDDTDLDVNSDLTSGDSVIPDENDEEVTLSAYTLSIKITYGDESQKAPEYASMYLSGSYDSWASWSELSYKSETESYTITFDSIAVGTYEYQVVLDYTDSQTIGYTYRVTTTNASFTVNESDGDNYTNSVVLSLDKKLEEIIPNPNSVKTNVKVKFKITYNGSEESPLSYGSLYIQGSWDSWTEFLKCDIEDSYYTYTFSSLSPTEYKYCAVLYYSDEDLIDNPYESYKVNDADQSFTVTGDFTDGGTITASLEATKSLSDILPEPVEETFDFADEDTTGYPAISVYEVLNRYTYYTGDRVVVEGATVVGRHGNVITLQQSYSSSLYYVEVWCLSIPEDVSIGRKADVIGTVTVQYGRRIVLNEARVQDAGTASISYSVKARLINRDAYDLFYYSGFVIKHQYRVLYEVKATNTTLTEDDEKVLTVPGLYRAFRVEWRNWYKGSSSYTTGTDRGYTYIVIYDDLNQDTKDFYDKFFDGTDQTFSYGNKTYVGGLDGVIPKNPNQEVDDINDYYWFDAYSKYQYYYEDFYVNFDEFEAKYLTVTDYQVPDLTQHQNITAILSGFFDDGDQVTLTGVLMEQHGSNLTIQEYDGTKGSGLCLEVELKQEEETKLKTAYALLITVKGTVKLHESPTLFDYTHTLVDATIDYDAQATETELEGDGYDIINHYNEGKTRTYYGNSSIYSVTNNYYGEYSAAYMHAGLQIVYLPDKDYLEEDQDYWFVGRLRYTSGSVTYVTSEYVPVVVYKDEQTDEQTFFKAVFNGTETDTELTKSAYRSNGSSKLTIGTSSAPVIGAGTTGLEVGDIISSNFMKLNYFEQDVELKFDYNGTSYDVTDDRYLSLDFNSASVMTFPSGFTA